MITLLGEYPSLAIGPLLDSHKHDVGAIMREFGKRSASARPLSRAAKNVLKDAPLFWRSTPDKWSMPRSFTQAKSTRCSATLAKSSPTILFDNLAESPKA